jgi:hypothetical protein|tara:strand:- start:1898 stop:2146 length:249 start_codon:yes stop_codon:yes gene_type:complete
MVSVWNITFDIDGKLYVLDESKKNDEDHVGKIIRYLNETIVAERDLKPMDMFDWMGIFDHPTFQSVYDIAEAIEHSMKNADE